LLLDTGCWLLATGCLLLATGNWLSRRQEARYQRPAASRAALCGYQKQAASDEQPEQSLTDSDNNSMLENTDFCFIFCFNEVNMLRGIRGLAPTGMMELWKNGIMVQGVWIKMD